MTVLRHPNNNGVTLSQWRKTAAGGETSLSGTDDFSAGLSYTVGAEQVFVNGVLIERGVDYTASTGTTVTGLTALVAGDIVTVSSPSSFQVANAIPKNTITAKGDLIVATGASTPANLAVGADGTTLVANSSASTGVSWAGPSVAAGKNAVIGGGFDIWQRGTSFANPASSAAAYSADRWQSYRAAYATGITTSQQSSGLTGFQYNIRVQRNSGNTDASNALYLLHNLETKESIRFAGQNATWSFYARAGANYSPTSNLLAVQLNVGTGTDENYITGSYTGGSNVISSTATLTTSWQRFTFTGAIPSTTTELSVRYSATPTGTAGAADYFEIAGVQLEVGSIATAFSRAGGTLQGELAACQRYYWRNTAASGSPLSPFGTAYTSSGIMVYVPFPVPMRTTPSSTIDGNAVNFSDANNAAITGGTATMYAANQFGATITSTVSGATQYRPYYAYAGAGAYLGFTAEL